MRVPRECYAAPGTRKNFMQNGTRLAAVDLGSNSFRLEIGRLEHGQIHRTEYLKETVRQGNGLDAERNLTAEAMQRVCDLLGPPFGQYGAFGAGSGGVGIVVGQGFVSSFCSVLQHWHAFDYGRARGSL